MTHKGWQKFFKWLANRFFAKQDKLSAGPGISITDNVIGVTYMPTVIIKNSEMLELLRNKTWQPNVMYISVNDENPEYWVHVFNGHTESLAPDEFNEFVFKYSDDESENA